MIQKIGSKIPFYSKRPMKKLMYLNMVGRLSLSLRLCYSLKRIQIPDFLDWSLTHDKELLSCLSIVSDGILRQSLYPLEAVKWLSVIRSQFVQAELCTVQSVARLESIMKEETLESDMIPQGESIIIDSSNASD
jgi:hypothetical protein